MTIQKQPVMLDGGEELFKRGMLASHDFQQTWIWAFLGGGQNKFYTQVNQNKLQTKSQPFKGNPSLKKRDKQNLNQKSQVP